jgi:hypothetical protein
VVSAIEQEGSRVDPLAAVHWVTGIGGPHKPDWEAPLPWEAYGSILLTLFDIAPSEHPDANFQRGLQTLVFDVAYANASSAAAKRAEGSPWQEAGAWADWLASRALAHPKAQKDRIAILGAMGLESLARHAHTLLDSPYDYVQEELVDHIAKLVKTTTDGKQAERGVAVVMAELGRFGDRVWESLLYDVRQDEPHIALWARGLLPAIARWPIRRFAARSYALSDLHERAKPELRPEIVATVERYAAAHKNEVLARLSLAVFRYQIEGFPAKRLGEALVLLDGVAIPVKSEAWELGESAIWTALVDRLEDKGKPQATADLDAALQGIKLTPALRDLAAELRHRVRDYAPFVFSM